MLQPIAYPSVQPDAMSFIVLCSHGAEQTGSVTNMQDPATKAMSISMQVRHAVDITGVAELVFARTYVCISNRWKHVVYRCELD